MPEDKKQGAVAFLKAALACRRRLGVTGVRVMTGDGACCKAFAFRKACRELRLKHIAINPDMPKTNGKAERRIETALCEWAYAHPHPTSRHRDDALPAWLHRCDRHRPHGGLNSAPYHTRQPPRRLSTDDLLRLYV